MEQKQRSTYSIYHRWSQLSLSVFLHPTACVQRKQENDNEKWRKRCSTNVSGCWDTWL